MFSITTSHNNMKAIAITNPSDDVRDFIRNAVLENRMNHPAYIAKQKGTPFLQADYPEYLLVEFWGKDPEPFMNWLNSNYKN